MGKEVLSNRPALRVALLFVVGILLAHALPVGPLFFLLPGLAAILVSLVLFFTNHSTGLSLTLHAAVGLAAASLFSVDADRSESNRLLPHSFQEPVTVEGVIDARP
ncbi:MAG: hypothetical protein WEB62_06125, partial [Bacteroidota bacterium]